MDDTDNASKALIMAGATLIAVLVVSLAMYMINVFRDYSESASLRNRSSQDESFNRYFVFSDINGGRVYGYDAYNLIGKVIEINEDLDFYNTPVNVTAPTIIVNNSVIIPNAEHMRLFVLPFFSGDNLTKEYEYSYRYGSDGRISMIELNTIP